MHRPHLVLLFAAGILATLPKLSRAQSPTPHAPNILFILADDLGPGDVGCYGQKQIQTPNIDKLATEGLRFTQAYAGAPVVPPSRCALMTGLHTGHGFIRGNSKVSLRPEDTTIAEVLSRAHYQTGAIGKWGLGEPDSPGTPSHKGFDFFYGFIDQTHAHNSYPSFLYRDDTKVPLKNVVPNEGPYGQGVATVRVQYVQDLCDDEALNYLDHVSLDRPFFFYAAYTAPHANNEAHANEVPDLGPYADKDWPLPQKQFAALVTRFDTSVGKLMQKLHDRHLDDNTLVIFASDNGAHEEGGNKAAFFDSNGPFHGIKRDVYEGGIRVPMIARWPGHVASNATTDQIFAFWDFPATAADLAGTTFPNSDGISILPAILGKPQTQQHEFLYWEFHENGFEQSVRTGDYKAVRHSPTQPLELYDLKTDIHEDHDIAKDHPDVIAKITAYLATARTDSKEFPIRAGRGRGASSPPG